MTLKYGKKPARLGAMKLKLHDYLDRSELPHVPRRFGDLKVWSTMPWGMLKNDTVGDCVVAGFAHQVMMWAATGGVEQKFTDAQVLDVYSKITGYDPSDPSTDQGTDMVQACQWWKDHEFFGHKIMGFAQVSPANIGVAAFLFGSVGVGLLMTGAQRHQFDIGDTWDVVPGSPVEGGHYVPIIGRNSVGNYLCVTWGRVQSITPRFIDHACDEAVCQLSQDWLSIQESVTPRGLKLVDLVNDMKTLDNS